MATSSNALKHLDSRRGEQCAGRAIQVALGQGHFGFGDDATRAGTGFVRPKAPRGALQQFAGAHQLAELRHGDAPQSQSGRVVTQGDALEGTQRIAGREGACGSGDQGVHGEVGATGQGEGCMGNQSMRMAVLATQPGTSGHQTP